MKDLVARRRNLKDLQKDGEVSLQKGTKHVDNVVSSEPTYVFYPAEALLHLASKTGTFSQIKDQVLQHHAYYGKPSGLLQALNRNYAFESISDSPEHKWTIREGWEEPCMAGLESYNNRELCCTFRTPYNRLRRMIKCARKGGCQHVEQGWCNIECVGLPEDFPDDVDWICDRCQKSKS